MKSWNVACIVIDVIEAETGEEAERILFKQLQALGVDASEGSEWDNFGPQEVEACLPHGLDGTQR